MFCIVSFPVDLGATGCDDVDIYKYIPSTFVLQGLMMLTFHFWLSTDAIKNYMSVRMC